MKEHLKILPVKKKDSKEKFVVDENLLDHPFSAILVAPPRSGKSNLIFNIIANHNIYPKGYWDEIIFISPTARFDKTYQHLEKLDNVVLLDDHEALANTTALVKGIVESQKEDLDKRILIIFDDMLGMLNKSADGISSFISRYRHYNCSVLFAVQSFRRLEKVIRNCASAMIIFHLPSIKEKEEINEEVGSQFSEHFLDILNDVTKEKFQFLTINLRDMKLIKNFEEEIDVALYK